MLQGTLLVSVDAVKVGKTFVVVGAGASVVEMTLEVVSPFARAVRPKTAANTCESVGAEWENGGNTHTTLSHNMNSEGDIQDSIGELLHPEVKYFLRTRQALIVYIALW